MPTYDFLLQGHQEFETKRFEICVDKMLSGHQPLFSITKFSLRSDEHFDASQVYQWISNIVRCNIEELNLALPDDRPINLPISLFTCKSLLELRLQLNICLSLPEFICIPKLKILHLSNIGLHKLLAEQLILNAALLEELVLSKCQWSDWNESTLNISAPALKYFRFYDPVTHDGVRSGTVKIHAPNLRHLTCIGNIAKDYVLSSFPSLDDAEVCFKFKRNLLDTRGAEIGLAASKLVGALSNVTSLIISGETLEALSFANDLPTFQNLTHLTVTSGCRSLADKVLLKLFQSAPNLESLVLQELPMNTPEFGQVVFWSLSIAIGCPLARLKSVHLEEFSWHPRDMSFIKLILNNAKVFEKATFGTTTPPISGILARIELMERLKLWSPGRLNLIRRR
ncbi:F-box/LRR-repeat protein At4g14103-like [Papaver somniferum]|uniref:F-box/LRR-repeat protein At4g14103-like n=1 Tax=Papaver somniferum TaxID=3469 RepID=UPI000E6F6E8A|nr:F-box/LRR-repeat protein At4g14103-like [Papaver somniferum]XP_026413487.1 F-box/LRR-repeat protein At4g14103-like [Papaver somniferum]XP_026413488.1 F-box/LRR-repeat protein At4g14103-like [Papaver somniferum]XP_026413489.1 F-box/LRR-repeat protein At4g14103-like [Papaver somniferum]XP_026413490.1 F-box/LRR-repeat protein At4g14103-like [Papaver somniferum]XP_026413491.1 F-box/LRR-repeat protein At4g14103-like [Papaver somniferum]